MSSASDVDFSSVGGNLLSPPTRDPSAAADAAGASRSVASVWERMSARGVIPDDWVQSDARRFSLEPWRPLSRADGSRARWSQTPPTVEAAVTIASDVAGVTRAEQSAREWHWRLAPFLRLSPFGGVVWRVLRVTPGARDLWPTVASGHPLACGVSRAALVSMLLALGASPDLQWSSENDPRLPAEVAGSMRRASAAIRAAEGARAARLAGESDMMILAIDAVIFFDDASRLGGRVHSESRGTSSKFFDDAVAYGAVAVGDRLSSIPNPHAPALDILANGYLPGQFHEMEGRSWAVLCAPAVEGFRRRPSPPKRGGSP